MSMENLGPYTNFHELNQDWFLNEFNKLVENWKAMKKNFNSLQEAFNDLKSYVQDYFKNLDVQEEINNKLDEMTKDGTLGTIISSVISSPIIESVDSLDNMTDKNKMYVYNGELYVWNGNTFSSTGSSIPSLTNYFNFYALSVTDTNVSTLIPNKLLSNVENNYLAISNNLMTDAYITDRPISDTPIFLITFTPKSNNNTYVQIATSPFTGDIYVRSFWHKGDTAEWKHMATTELLEKGYYDFKYIVDETAGVSPTVVFPNKKLSDFNKTGSCILSVNSNNKNYITDSPEYDTTLTLINFLGSPSKHPATPITCMFAITQTANIYFKTQYNAEWIKIRTIDNKQSWCFLGDSIMYFNDYNFGLSTVMPVTNKTIYAKQSANLAVANENNICAQVDKLITDGKTYSHIMFDGGYNDWYWNTLGEIPTEIKTSDFDKTTICGAFSYICYTLTSNNPDAQIYYVCVHKINTSDTTAGHDGGQTMTEITEALKKICKLYGVKVFDIFNESSLLTRFENRKVFTRGDGIHPTQSGYEKFYLPLILPYI